MFKTSFQSASEHHLKCFGRFIIIKLTLPVSVDILLCKDLVRRTAVKKTENMSVQACWKGEKTVTGFLECEKKQYSYYYVTYTSCDIKILK